MYDAPSSVCDGLALHDSGAPVLDLDPYDAAFLADPYPFHTPLRDAGPIVWLPRYRVFAAARHAEVRAILQDATSFCSAGGVGLTNFLNEPPWRQPSPLLEADAPVHTRVRAVMARVLAPVRLKGLQEMFVAQADALVGRLAARGRFDAITDLAEPFLLKVFPDAIGMAEAGRENLLVYGNLVADAFGPFDARLRAALRDAAPAFAWVQAQCRQQALRPGGLGAQLHDAADTGEIPREEAELLVRALLGAGLETTVGALGNLLFCLATHPAEWQRLRRDPALLRPAIEEALRCESPAQTFFRTTAHPVEIAGVRMPAGQKVMLFLGAANRDPRRWDVPERFDIARRPAGQLAFGAGIHVCVGSLLARMEAEAVLRALLSRVATIDPDGPPRRRPSSSIRALARLPLRAGPGV